MLTWFLIVALAVGAPASFDGAREMAQKQLGSLTPSQSVDLSTSLSHAVATSSRLCSIFHSRLESFGVALSIDETGHVQQTWRHGSSDYVRCLERKLSSATLAKPPFAPFFITYEFAVEP